MQELSAAREKRLVEKMADEVKRRIPPGGEFACWIESGNVVAGDWLPTSALHFQKTVELDGGTFEITCETHYNANHRDDITEDDINVPITASVTMINLLRNGFIVGERLLFKGSGYYKWQEFFDTAMKIFLHLEEIIKRGIEIAADGRDWFPLIVARAVIRENENVPQLSDDLRLFDSDHMDGENHDYDELE